MKSEKSGVYTFTTFKARHLSSQSPIKIVTVCYISVPVKNVDLTLPVGDEITVIEDQMFELRCASEGRPRPTIEWYKQRDTEPEILLPGGNNTHTSEFGIESVLLFYPNRTDNGYSVYCKAYNIDPGVNMESLHKLLNVLCKYIYTTYNTKLNRTENTSCF